MVLLKVDALGRPDIDQLTRLLEQDSSKTLVSLMHANNEIGTMIDLHEVATLTNEMGAYFHSDTVQTVGHFPINVAETPVSVLAGSGHKIPGQKGVGFVYISNRNMIHPMIDGGGQERNMRGGTENVYGIIGYAKALEMMVANLESEEGKIRSLRDEFRRRLTEEFPGVMFNGDIGGNSLYTVLSASFPPTDKSEMLLLALDIAGISASGGSACSSGAETGSHVLNAIKADPDRKTIRFSFSVMNSRDDIDYTISKLKALIPSAVRV